MENAESKKWLAKHMKEKQPERSRTTAREKSQSNF